MEGDDGALITVHGYAGVVEGLLGVAKLVSQIRHAALEDGAEVTGDQRSTDAYKTCISKVNILNFSMTI